MSRIKKLDFSSVNCYTISADFYINTTEKTNLQQCFFIALQEMPVRRCVEGPQIFPNAPAIFWIGVNNEKMTETATRLLNPEQKQESNGNICRVIRSKDYTTMSNFHLRDKTLSLKAKGLMSIVLSLPEDWNYSISGLVSMVQEGEFAVRNALKELKEHKYLLIKKNMPNSQTRILTYEYIFFESPRLYSLDSSNQDVGNQHLDNHGQLNIDKPNIDKPNKEIIISKPAKPVAGKKNLLQVFSNAVIESFESEVKTDSQKQVWFKRNCRNLKDILAFCNQDVEVAMFTIDETVEWLNRNHLQGGYEAVCRNLPEMHSKAIKRVESGEKWAFSDKVLLQLSELGEKRKNDKNDEVRGMIKNLLSGD